MAENRLKTGWESVAEKVLCKALTTGNIVPFGLLTIGTIIALRLPPPDLKEIALLLVNKFWFGAGGWVAFSISLYGCKRLLNWREAIHQAEVKRMAEIKNQAVQAHFELPLKTSEKNK